MSARDPWRRRSALLLVIILSLGAFLRCYRLGQSPPGLNQDEAVNAYDAYCLLQTGRDHNGASWPILYTQALGENRSALFVYYLLPFEAIGGLSIRVVRFASAFSGVVTLALVYYLGARLFSRPVGLLAAAFLALNPWHIHECRWAIEATLVPLLTAAALAGWLWARFPLDDREEGPPCPWRAIAAGLITGVSFYGYAAIRPFLLLFFLAGVMLTWPQWRRALGSRRGVAACALLATVTLALFAPVAWNHWAHAEGIGKRLEATRVWSPEDPAWTRVGKVLARHPLHFDPRVLFFSGDSVYLQSPPQSGLFQPYMLPLMVIGIVVLLREVKRSRSARVLLAWIVLYPVGDLLGGHSTLHALRSLPGLCGLILLAALGTARASTWLHATYPRIAVAAAAGLGGAVLLSQILFLKAFFVDFSRRPDVYIDFHADLVEACRLIRPDFDAYDAVYCTTDRLNMPYAVMLAALRYDPARWQAEPRQSIAISGLNAATRFGRVRFLYPGISWAGEIERMRNNDHRERVVFIIRPGEITGLKPARVISGPNGSATLWICELEL